MCVVPQELIYAGQRLNDNSKRMAEYHVPPVSDRNCDSGVDVEARE